MAWTSRMKDQRFERFYLEKIAIGEGCGCAEQAIGMLNMEAQAKKIAAQKHSPKATKTLWSRILDLIRRQGASAKYEANRDVS